MVHELPLHAANVSRLADSFKHLPRAARQGKQHGRATGQPGNGKGCDGTQRWRLKPRVAKCGMAASVALSML